MPLILLFLWFFLNGRFTLEIICFGVGITAVIYAFLIRVAGWSWRKELLLMRTAPILLLYSMNLLLETVKAAVSIARLSMTPFAHPEPVLVEFRSGLDREALNVILANSITLTPGTVTVFQEHDRFVVHALLGEYAEGLENSSFIRLLRRFPR